MTPLYQLGVFGYPVAMALATVLGIGFGFVLERAGFGRAGVLVSQFYGDDMRVFKVMFSGIVTTMVGLGLLGQLGLIDLSLIRIPETFVWPAVAGGLVLGVGFVMAGYCPGTALVAMSSGYLDGLVVLVGIMLGSLGFGFAYDQLADFYMSTEWGKLTFVEVLGVSWPVLAIIVTVLAIGMFLGAEWIERRRAPLYGRTAPIGDPQLRNALFVGLMLFATFGVTTLLRPTPRHVSADAGPAHGPAAVTLTNLATIDATTVAEHLARGHRDLYLVDLRSAAACQKARLPGALCLDADDPSAGFIANLTPTRSLVLYGADTLSQLPAAAGRFQGDVLVLEGGYAAWQRAVLSEPVMPADNTPEAVTRYNRAASLHQYFTGVHAPQAPIRAKPSAGVRHAAVRGGGC